LGAALLLLLAHGAAQAQTFQSFTLGDTSVVANGVERQRFEVRLSNAANVDEVRFLINRAGHNENGRTNSGYLKATAAGCQELGTGYGNADITLQTASCAFTRGLDNSLTVSLEFTVEPSFGEATNNQVSGVWYGGGTLLASWRRLTTAGAGFAVTGAPAAPAASLRSFSFDKSSTTADNRDVQTFRLVLNGAAEVDDVRLLVNRAGQNENGRTNSGYFQWKAGTGCQELTSSYGNADVGLQTTQCQANARIDGSVEFVFPFTIAPSFGVASNNQVSGIWYIDGVAKTSWTRLTTVGAGYAVVAGQSVTPPSSFGSFSLTPNSVRANGAEVGTVRLTLNDGAPVDDVRFLINRSGQSENGLVNSGYFQWTPATGCREYGTGYGNDKVVLQTASCQRTVSQSGAVEFVLPFTVLESFGAADNNQVSVIWYEAGVARSSWRKVTTTGAGFNITGSSAPVPAFVSFQQDEASVLSDGADVQTLRLVLSDAATVSEVRLLVNRAGHAENGRAASGYFQWTTTGCQEFGAGDGNADVTLQTAQCRANARVDGSVEYVFPFTVSPSFGVADNNTVSALWYVQGAAQSWTKVTQTGQGFDVAAPPTAVLNACGGVTTLASPPGTPCGPGNRERTICAGAEATTCDLGRTYSDLSVGYNHTCAIRTGTGALECWGVNEAGQATPPSGVYTKVSSGSEFSCALKNDSTLACWGRNDTGVNQRVPPTGTFKALDLGTTHGCAIRTNDTLACWGANLNGETNAPTGTFTALSAGDVHSCAVKTNGQLACWGLGSFGATTPPTGSNFQKVAAGSNFGCALTTAGALACWGDNLFQQATPPTGTFTDVSAGLGYACAVRNTGAIACWGYNDQTQASPFEGTFQKVSASTYHTCGLRTDGSAICWGELGYAASAVPRSGLCGGTSTPTPAPGTPCGPCNLNQYVCNGTQATTCSGATLGNACGGCTPIPDDPGDACGRCGLDRFVCTSSNATMCDGDTPANTCGGCSVLGQAPGTSCGQGNSRLVCASDESTTCSATLNLCGGATPLRQSPGTACTYGTETGFLACFDDVGVVCSAGYAPLQGDLVTRSPARLSAASNGEVFTADVNNDGYGDILSGAKIYLGPFLPGQTYSSAQRTTLTGAGRIEPVGDINGDGVVDLLLGNQNLVLGPVTSNANLTTNAAVLTGFNGHADGWGDFNGDGRDDLAMRTNSAVYVFYGPITGTKTTANANVTWVQGLWTNSVIADLNHDGRADLALERCALGTASGGARPVTFSSVLLGPPTANVNIENALLIRGSEPDSALFDHGCPRLARGGDTNGDGRDELAFVQPDHRTDVDFRRRVVLLRGPFTANVELGTPSSTSPPAGVSYFQPSAPSDSALGNLWVIGDADGDHQDEFLYDGFERLYSNEDFNISILPRSASGADINGDGFSDLVLERDTDVEIYFGSP
jgi:hypothetical protein